MPQTPAPFADRPDTHQFHLSGSRAAVLGHPIKHSLSPVLHRAAYQSLGLDWSYDAIDLTEPDLPEWLANCGPDWAGLSLTMPLKVAVLPLLTSIHPLAEQVRSVNTVLLSNGERSGFNTDVGGLAAVLSEYGVGAGTSVTVLGGGATARSAIAALAGLGVSDVTVSSRRDAPALELVALGTTLGISIDKTAWPPGPEAMTSTVVLSTVPISGSAALTSCVPAHPKILIDVLYDPWPTPLAAVWKSAGGTAVGGLELLVHQAADQVTLMTGARVSPTILRAAGQGELDRRRIAQAEQ